MTNPKTLQGHDDNQREQIAPTVIPLTRQHFDHNELQLPYQIRSKREDLTLRDEATGV